MVSACVEVGRGIEVKEVTFHMEGQTPPLMVCARAFDQRARGA